MSRFRGRHREDVLSASALGNALGKELGGALVGEVLGRAWNVYRGGAPAVLESTGNYTHTIFSHFVRLRMFDAMFSSFLWEAPRFRERVG